MPEERLCQSYGSDPQIGARTVTPQQYPLTRRVKISFHSKNVFFGIAVRSWWESWQARKTNGKGGSGSVKNKSLSEMRQLSEEHVFVLTHCNVHPSSNICEQYGAHLCCLNRAPDRCWSHCDVFGTWSCRCVPESRLTVSTFSPLQCNRNFRSALSDFHASAGARACWPLKPALDREDRPVADSRCLGRHSVSNAAITIDQHGRSGTSGGKMPKALTDACTLPERDDDRCHMRMNEKGELCCDAFPKGAGIARRMRASVSCRHPFKHRWKLGSFLGPKRLNDGQ